MNFSKCLEKLMTLENITVKELSRKANITETSICHYKSGYRQPSILKASQLLNALGYKLVIRKINHKEE